MEKQILLDKKGFEELERNVLEKVMTTSKTILESFKFHMIYKSKVSEKQEAEAVNAVKECRKKKLGHICF